MGRIINVKSVLFLMIIILSGYLTSKYPTEAVLIAGVAVVLVIGIWLLQIEK